MVGESIRSRFSLSQTVKDKFILALTYAVEQGNNEHPTVRYIVMLLIIIFNDECYNILPQLRTWTGYFPDIAIETFYQRPSTVRSIGFVCCDFLEAKSANSSVDPFVQLHNGVANQYGFRHYSKGLLMGVVGLKWRFEEYHLVKVPNQTDPLLLTLPFQSSPLNTPEDHTRPKLSRAYTDNEYMDLTKKKEAIDVLNILIWRAQKGKTRDLFFMRHHAQPLPKSLTHATLIVDDEEEETVLPNEEYKHIVAYLGQEEDRMEMD